MVCNDLVAGGQLLGAEQQVMLSGTHNLEKLTKHIKISSKLKFKKYRETKQEKLFINVR